MSVEVSEPLLLKLNHKGRVLSVRMEAVYVKGTGLGINLGRPFMKAVRGSLDYAEDYCLVCKQGGVVTFSAPVLSATVRSVLCYAMETQKDKVEAPALLPLRSTTKQC